MLLTFDTETTGIPVNGVPSNDPRHPHLVSISAVLDNDQGDIRHVFSTLIKPRGYLLESFPEAQKVHGITTEQAQRFGMELEDAIGHFENLMKMCAVISAFNIHFDLKLLKIACARHLLNDIGERIRQTMESKNGLCSMEAAANHLIGKKRISLKNAYFDIFKQEIQKGVHGSLEDAMSARAIYYHLKGVNALPEPKPLTRKEYDTPYQEKAAG